jgi:hypothetical protein
MPLTKKKASHTLVKKTAVITDRKKDKEPNKSTKSDKNNEKVCANRKSSTSRRKQPSDSHGEVTDMMKGTPKVSILM